MYNRYIPQSDGTYRRSAQPDVQNHSSQRQPQQRRDHRQDNNQKQNPTPCENDAAVQNTQHLNHHPPGCTHYNNGYATVGSFLKNLLPKNFDTGDLLIVLLLLLMAGDCQEDQNTALLTLVLYLFL